MKSNANKRTLATVIVLASCWLPCVSIACLSGAEQENIVNTLIGTGTEMVADGLITTASVNTGNALADAWWNGGVNWFFRGVQTVSNSWFAQQVDHRIPDDPFP